MSARQLPGREIAVRAGRNDPREIRRERDAEYRAVVPGERGDRFLEAQMPDAAHAVLRAGDFASPRQARTLRHAVAGTRRSSVSAIGRRTSFRSSIGGVLNTHSIEYFYLLE